MALTTSRPTSQPSSQRSHIQSSNVHTDGVNWAKRMSNNCAYALLAYTMLQIFFVIKFIKTESMSIAPYFGLVVLVAIIIPFCRGYEKRWENMAKNGLQESGLATRFRIDQLSLWALALGLPLLFVGLIKLF